MADDTRETLPPTGDGRTPPILGGAPDVNVALATIVSLFIPALGMLFLEDRVAEAFVGLGISLLLWGISFFLAFEFFLLCCMPLAGFFHLFAGLYTYDQCILQQGGKPILFKRRIIG